MLVQRPRLVSMQSTDVMQAELALEGAAPKSHDDGQYLCNRQPSHTAAAVAGDAHDDRQSLCSAQAVPSPCIAQAWLIILCSFSEIIAAVLEIMHCTRFVHHDVTNVLHLTLSTSTVI